MNFLKKPLLGLNNSLSKLKTLMDKSPSRAERSKEMLNRFKKLKIKQNEYKECYWVTSQTNRKRVSPDYRF